MVFALLGLAAQRRGAFEDGEPVPLLRVRFMARTEETGGGFSLVEHPIPPLTLVAPLHRHSREDEYSFVLEAGVRPLRLREGDPRLA